MSALAGELGIGRATLYRWVGNREELLASVLSEATERTFHRAAAAARGTGVELVLDTLRRFMVGVVNAPALRKFTQREPLLFLRLATTPGAVEKRAGTLVCQLLEREAAAGRLRLAMRPAVLAGAIVRLSDAHLYAHLVSGNQPEIDTALELVGLLLNRRAPAPVGIGSMHPAARRPRLSAPHP
jgi:AcrR family transcriptional regulator